MSDAKYLHSLFLKKIAIVALVSCFIVVVGYVALIPAFYPELRTYKPLLIGAIAIFSFSGVFITRYWPILKKGMIAVMCFEAFFLCVVYFFLVIAIGVLAKGS